VQVRRSVPSPAYPSLSLVHDDDFGSLINCRESMLGTGQGRAACGDAVSIGRYKRTEQKKLVNVRIMSNVDVGKRSAT